MLAGGESRAECQVGEFLIIISTTVFSGLDYVGFTSKLSESLKFVRMCSFWSDTVTYLWVSDVQSLPFPFCPYHL